MRLPPDTVIDGRFRIVAQVGEGGMGYVYLAQQLDLDRQVALKFLDPYLSNGTALKRFQQEAKILATFVHPNIVRVHCFGQAAESFYIAMEYVEGASLSEVVRRGVMKPERATQVVRQVVEALSYAHERGIVHRDLKPSNVLLSNDQVKIIDFGLARQIISDSEQKLTEPGSTVGTVAFMSPEQCMSADIDHRSDIYSLGCLLHFILTGKAPFDGFNLTQVMSDHIEAPIPSLINENSAPGLEQLNAVMQRCLQKEPEDRYQSAAEILPDLEDFAPLPAVPVVVSSTRKASTKKFPVLGVACAVLVLTSAFAFLALAFQPHRTAPVAEDITTLPLIALRQRMDHYILKRDWGNAIACAKQALTLQQPESERSTSYHQLWQCYDAANQHAQALAVAKQYSQQRGSWGVDGMARMAQSESKLGHRKAAVELWKKVEAQNGFSNTNLENYVYYAEALRAMNDNATARRVIKDGLAICTPTDKTRWEFKALKDLEAEQ